MKAHGITDLGKVRQNNEDNFYCSLEDKLFIVADGLGGHSAGEVASSMTVEHVSKGKPKNIDDLIQLISEANTKVHEEAKRLGNDMGTTISALIIDNNDEIYIAHVGDSRIYMIRENEIYCITEDHTPVMESLREGLLTLAQSKNHPLRHMLSRTIGTQPEVEIDAINVDKIEGDIFVLCTDGLSNLHEDYEIRDIALKTPDNAEQIVKNLIESALDRGGTDNVSVISLVI
ncbi:MAG: protein phosphatase 2C domain-containing protein [Candidatus Sericytochromatia bacterium]